ncbi:hypothetical protein JI664_07965 [Rhodobacter sp. NTK016B]|uniref:hypothetical protein n=1 Tax=Rhodobacter sp. NTK016B TaxID=2759676 RepID=UPI001A8FC5B3|nr:hypothetical protein [Rhodobacter sp. NTK016B]MBN8291894.1 hypothetical protein [Rhodobacter sp. NTK016B]
MFISITYPVADFRNLHRENAGRLERPAWGRADPQAHFARGLGSIHTRTKSANGFTGENYYADCDNLVRYPKQFFLTPIPNLNRTVLAYPFYRRFYFDGLMAGRFELGFRLNEGSIEHIAAINGKVDYSASTVARQILENDLRVELTDGRKLTQPFWNSMDALRDGWLLSSTKTQALKTFDIETVGSNYVGVGRPFAFIRAGRETTLSKEHQMRMLLKRDDLKLFVTRSGVHGQHFDTAANPSLMGLDNETAKERLARLFYSQIRTLAFAHSFYLRQVSSGKIAGPKSLEPAVQSLLDRLADLEPLEGQESDELTCEELRKILISADIDTGRLTREIEEQVNPGWFRRNLGFLLGYFDQKADIAIEAAASAATKQLLSGGP